MIFQWPGDILADRLAAHRNACTVDRFAAPADQIMPIMQGQAIGAQPIGAALGEPVHRGSQTRSEAKTIRHKFPAVLVVTASAALDIQQFAGDVSRIDRAAILILHLVQAALAAAIA